MPWLTPVDILSELMGVTGMQDAVTAKAAPDFIFIINKTARIVRQLGVWRQGSSVRRCEVMRTGGWEHWRFLTASGRCVRRQTQHRRDPRPDLGEGRRATGIDQDGIQPFLITEPFLIGVLACEYREIGLGGVGSGLEPPLHPPPEHRQRRVEGEDRECRPAPTGQMQKPFAPLPVDEGGIHQHVVTARTRGGSQTIEAILGPVGRMREIDPRIEMRQ